MTKEMIKNGEEFWVDDSGNSLVVDENGGVYLVTDNGIVRYITDDIRKIYDEKNEGYFIDGMSIDRYIKRVKSAAEISAVWSTTAQNTESITTKSENVTAKNVVKQAAEKTVTATSKAVTEVPARVIYQTIYNAPETEELKNEEQKKDETEP